MGTLRIWYKATGWRYKPILIELLLISPARLLGFCMRARTKELLRVMRLGSVARARAVGVNLLDTFPEFVAGPQCTAPLLNWRYITQLADNLHIEAGIHRPTRQLATRGERCHEPLTR